MTRALSFSVSTQKKQEMAAVDDIVKTMESIYEENGIDIMNAIDGVVQGKELPVLLRMKCTNTRPI